MKQINNYVVILSDEPDMDLKYFIRLMQDVGRDLTAHKNQMLSRDIELIYYLTIWDSQSFMLPLLEKYQKHFEAKGIQIGFHKLDDHVKSIRDGSALLSIYHASNGIPNDVAMNIRAIEPLYRHITLDVNKYYDGAKYHKVAIKNKKGKVRVLKDKGIKEIAE